jgi:hypothetical protein
VQLTGQRFRFLLLQEFPCAEAPLQRDRRGMPAPVRRRRQDGDAARARRPTIRHEVRPGVGRWTRVMTSVSPGPSGYKK